MEHIWTRELGVERVQELNQDLEDLTAELRRIDLEKSQIIQPEQEVNQRELDETMSVNLQALEIRFKQI